MAMQFKVTNLITFLSICFFVCAIAKKSRGDKKIQQLNDLSDEEFLMRMCDLRSQDEISEYRFYKTTAECFKIGSKGPCGRNMIFREQDKSHFFGICVCNPEESRPLIYDKDADKCHFIFEQGYCPPGEWLTWSRFDGRPMCERNPCQHDKILDSPSQYIVLFNNRCVKLGHEIPECGRNEVVGFEKVSIFPKCISKQRQYSHGWGIRKYKSKN